MYYLICFEIKSKNKNLRYPLPPVLDVAVLDERLELQDKKQIILPILENQSNEALLQCWKVGIEEVIAVLAQTEKRFLVFPTSQHLGLFHIIKSKCRLHTKSSGNGVLEKLIASDAVSDTGTPQETSLIEKMISITKAIGAHLLQDHPDVFPDLSRSKIKNNGKGMVACSYYSYIVDTTTGKFHNKDSICLQNIPVEYWRGVGKDPTISGFKPCRTCIGYFQKTIAPVLSPEETAMYGQAMLKRLINGNYASSRNIIARCHNLIHRGYLSKNLIESHDCIAKKCPFFEKLKPEYWKGLESEAQKKKKERLKRKEALKLINARDVFIRETLEVSGCVHVTLIKDEKPNLLVISYIYDRKIDLTPEIQFLRKELGKTIKLQARKGADDVIELLIRKPRREMYKVTDLLNAPKVGLATKKRLASLGIYCLEDLFGRSGDALYRLDCKLSSKSVNRRYLTAYRSAVKFANEMDLSNPLKK